MSLTGITFIFVFLPISLGIYYLVQGRGREYTLFGISIVFYVLIAREFALLFLFSIFINILGGRLIYKKTDKVRLLLLIIGIAYNICILGYYKYLQMWVPSNVQEENELVLPLGISFFTFKAISYLVDIYNGKAKLKGTPIQDALYLSFFGQVISGPLSRYDEMVCVCKKKDDIGQRINHFADGVYRFVIGFNKKILIADMLEHIVRDIFSSSADTRSTGYVWLGAVCYSLYLFFDFAGYSDMAIGLTKMFGYECKENFLYPYMTNSVSEFWRRWHVSLGMWFRDYVYIPLGGSRTRKEWHTYRNLFIVWILTGIWHGSSWNFVIWGLTYFIMIALEKKYRLPDRLSSKLGKTVYRVMVLLLVNFEWVIFRIHDIRECAVYLYYMIVPHTNSIADARTLFLIKEYFAVIFFAVAFCIPVWTSLEQKMQREKIRMALDVIVGLTHIALFIVSLSFIVTGITNPFAYTNF